MKKKLLTLCRARLPKGNNGACATFCVTCRSECLDRFTESVEVRMRVACRHAVLFDTVAKQGGYVFDRNLIAAKPRRKSMAQIMNTEVQDHGILAGLLKPFPATLQFKSGWLANDRTFLPLGGTR